MPKLEANATVKTVQEVRLEPSLRKKLLTKLRAYENVKAQIDALEHAKKKLANELGELRDETGETSVSLEGFSVTLVAGVRKKFNAKLFVSKGGDLQVYNQSFDDVPIKAYTKITLPGGRNDDEE